MGNDTHYRVRCGYCSSNTIYSGYSRSEYDYYRNSTIRCSSCADDYNRRQRERAEAELREQRRREEERRGREMAELERQRKERLEREREQRERQRRLEQQRIMAQQQAEENERMRKLKEAQEKKAEELKKIAEELKKENDKRRSQSEKSHPLLQFKKLETVKTVEKIAQQVEQCAVVGQVITNTVNDVANELKRSLNDEYSLVEPQMRRYQKYGDELSNMKGEFTKTFEKVFEEEGGDIDELFELMEAAPEEAEEYAEEMKLNMKRLVNGMNDMESRLFLMSQYYDQISLDYEEFMEFCSSKQFEFKGIPDSLKRVAAKFKGKRDINEGLDDDEKIEQITEFSTTYTTITANEITQNETDWKKVGRSAAIGAAVGGGVGLIGGAAIGAACGGPVGAVIGAAIGGAVLGGLVGGIVGGIIGLANSRKTTTKVENVEQQCVLTEYMEKTTYDGSEHSKALEKIIEALKPKLELYVQKLEQQEDAANQELIKIDRLKTECESMQKLLSGFRKEVKEIMEKDISKIQAKMMKKKWDSFKKEIKPMLNDKK